MSSFRVISVHLLMNVFLELLHEYEEAFFFTEKSKAPFLAVRCSTLQVFFIQFFSFLHSFEIGMITTET